MIGYRGMNPWWMTPWTEPDQLDCSHRRSHPAADWQPPDGLGGEDPRLTPAGEVPQVVIPDYVTFAVLNNQ